MTGAEAKSKPLVTYVERPFEATEKVRLADR